jgi:hypothetical protein
MPIAFDFLGKGEIRIKGTKIKKCVIHGWHVPKILWKIHLGPQYLKITQLYNLGPFKF